MITNQLHDLHATGADLTVEGRIIAEADNCRIRTDEIMLREDRSYQYRITWTTIDYGYALKSF